jgi:hypothetical protein
VKNTSYIHPKCNKTSFTSSLVWITHWSDKLHGAELFLRS